MRLWLRFAVVLVAFSLWVGGHFVFGSESRLVVKDDGITYVCDRCGVKLPTTDKSYKTRYCSGTKDQPHSKIIMRRSN